MSEQHEVSKVAAWIPLAGEVLRDAIANPLERFFRPWLFPDGNPMPELDLFPWATRAWALTAEARRRVTAAGGILANGLPDDEDDDW